MEVGIEYIKTFFSIAIVYRFHLQYVRITLRMLTGKVRIAIPPPSPPPPTPTPTPTPPHKKK